MVPFADGTIGPLRECPLARAWGRGLGQDPGMRQASGPDHPGGDPARTEPVSHVPSPPEPWRVKAVEPIRLAPREAREVALAEAGHNVFRLRSEDVFIDLLTDSGTAAMSADQWAGLQVGDEAYAGARNWYRLEQTVTDVTGFPFVIPVHQGRGAETVYCRAFVDRGDLVLGNLHFDTTRAHIRNRGAEPVDLVVPEGLDPDDSSPFKGNVDLSRAERVIEENPGRVRLFVLTVTCNTNGGQPVSLENARAVAALCRRHGIRLLLDAARFAENCFLVREREPGQQGRSVRDIARELFSLADGAAMSAKKDALVNIGGFLALRREEDYLACRRWAVLYEGYLTYGGMAGRDLEALARGLLEGMDETYLEARMRQVRFLHGLLSDGGIPVVRPPGGHGVVVDAARFLEPLPRDLFPAESLAAALYLEGGVRAAGLGGLALGERDPTTGALRLPPWEYLRLAIPRRVYTDNHLAYAAAVLRDLWAKAGGGRGAAGGRRPRAPPPLHRDLRAGRPVGGARGGNRGERPVLAPRAPPGGDDGGVVAASRLRRPCPRGFLPPHPRPGRACPRGLPRLPGPRRVPGLRPPVPHALRGVGRDDRVGAGVPATRTPWPRGVGSPTAVRTGQGAAMASRAARTRDARVTRVRRACPSGRAG